MKYCFAVLLCVIAMPVIAQTSYADFIQSDNKIQWAAEYDQLFNITPRVKKFGIKESLVRQLQAKGYIDNYRISNDSVAVSKFTVSDVSQPLDSFQSNDRTYHDYIDNYYDSAARSSFFNNEQTCSCTSNVSDNKLDIYKIKQVIYYENNKLYIKNILVTPLCLKRAVNAGDGEFSYIWQYAYASCFNDSVQSLSAAVKKRCIDLGNREEKYDLTYNMSYDTLAAKIFTLQNPVFSHHLFEDLVKGRITAVDVINNNIIPAKKVLGYGMPSIEAPEYDSVGDVTGYKKVAQEYNIDSFYKYSINQHFYFDNVNNILYSQVNYMDVYRKVYTSEGVFIGEAPLFRVYFVRPALYKKPEVNHFD